MKSKITTKLISTIKENKVEDKVSIYNSSITARIIYSIKLVLMLVVTYILCDAITKYMYILIPVPRKIQIATMIVSAIAIVLMANYIVISILCMFSQTINKYLRIFK